MRRVVDHCVCTHTHTRTDIHTHTQTPTHTHTQMHPHTDIHTHTHRCTHTQTHTHTDAHRCTHTQTHTHRCTHTQTHTRTHTHTHTDAHTHTQACCGQCAHPTLKCGAVLSPNQSLQMFSFPISPVNRRLCCADFQHSRASLNWKTNILVSCLVSPSRRRWEGLDQSQSIAVSI